MSNWTAVFYTEGDGRAVLRGDSYVWEVPPEWMKDAKAGDPIPDEWTVAGPFNSETGERLYDESDLIDFEDLERFA